MKIVILSGSPHRDGTTAALIKSFTAGAEQAGHEVVRFDAAFLSIHPCMACEKCHSSESASCVFSDDMKKITKELENADCIAFVTPIYYYGVCSQLKTIVDRFYGIEPVIRNHQKAVFITAMSDDRPETVRAANAWFGTAMEWMEWQECGILNALGCTVPDDLKNTDYEKQAYDLGANL